MRKTIRDLIADDVHAARFQSIAPYRTELLQFIDATTTAVYGQMMETILRMADARIDCAITTDGRTVFVNCGRGTQQTQPSAQQDESEPVSGAEWLSLARDLRALKDARQVQADAGAVAWWNTCHYQTLFNAIAAATTGEAKGTVGVSVIAFRKAMDAAHRSPEEAPDVQAVELELYRMAYGTTAPTNAAMDVLAERQRQISAEGWTPDHDDEHVAGEMAQAAACYAYPYITAIVGLNAWPWDGEWFKPDDPRRNLVKAGALILAEIERIDRAANTPAIAASNAENNDA